MSANVLQFKLGMDSAGFIDGIKRSETALASVGNKTAAFANGLHHAGGEMLGMRERTEVLRHSLDQMGGSFSALAELSRMMLDPLTLGFAVVFGAMELMNKAFEKSAEEAKKFTGAAQGVENIVKGIVAARPTSTNEWMEFTKQIAALTEHTADLKGFADAFVDVQKGMDENNATAGQEQLEIEQQKIELLRAQHKISSDDAAKRIEALKNQAVLQKNLSERTAIQHELSGRQSELKHVSELASKNPIASALDKKMKADANVADLQKQIEDLPKAIEGNKNLIAQETAKYKSSSVNSWARSEAGERIEQLNKRNEQLGDSLNSAKQQFPSAVTAAGGAHEDFKNAQGYKSRADELDKMIPGLQNKLTLTMDRQKKTTPFALQKNHLEALKKEIVPNYKTEHTSLEKMGFVMGGSSSPMKRSEDLLGQILGAIKGKTQNPDGTGESGHTI